MTTPVIHVADVGDGRSKAAICGYELQGIELPSDTPMCRKCAELLLAEVHILSKFYSEATEAAHALQASTARLFPVRADRDEATS